MTFSDLSQEIIYRCLLFLIFRYKIICCLKVVSCHFYLKKLGYFEKFESSLVLIWFALKILNLVCFSMAGSLSTALICALSFLVHYIYNEGITIWKKKGIEMYWGAVFFSDIFRSFLKKILQLRYCQKKQNKNI